MLVIREAGVDDAPILAAAERIVAAEPGLLASRPEEVTDAVMTRRIQGAARFLVAEDDGAPVGHAMLDPMALAAVAHVLHLSIVVHDGQRRRGIGERLLRELLTWAERTGVVKIELRVRATNSGAIALYRKVGFVDEGVLRRRVRLPDGQYLDDLSMAWLGPSGH
jgi:putative acetyltransferase